MNAGLNCIFLLYQKLCIILLVLIIYGGNIIAATKNTTLSSLIRDNTFYIKKSLTSVQKQHARTQGNKVILASQLITEIEKEGDNQSGNLINMINKYVFYDSCWENCTKQTQKPFQISQTYIDKLIELPCNILSIEIVGEFLSDIAIKDRLLKAFKESTNTTIEYAISNRCKILVTKLLNEGSGNQDDMQQYDLVELMKNNQIIDGITINDDNDKHYHLSHIDKLKAFYVFGMLNGIYLNPKQLQDQLHKIDAFFKMPAKFINRDFNKQICYTTLNDNYKKNYLILKYIIDCVLAFSDNGKNNGLLIFLLSKLPIVDIIAFLSEKYKQDILTPITNADNKNIYTILRDKLKIWYDNTDQSIHKPQYEVYLLSICNILFCVSKQDTPSSAITRNDYVRNLAWSINGSQNFIYNEEAQHNKKDFEMLYLNKFVKCNIMQHIHSNTDIMTYIANIVATSRRDKDAWHTSIEQHFKTILCKIMENPINDDAKNEKFAYFVEDPDNEVKMCRKTCSIADVLSDFLYQKTFTDIVDISYWSYDVALKLHGYFKILDIIDNHSIHKKIDSMASLIKVLVKNNQQYDSTKLSGLMHNFGNMITQNTCDKFNAYDLISTSIDDTNILLAHYLFFSIFNDNGLNNNNGIFKTKYLARYIKYLNRSGKDIIQTIIKDASNSIHVATSTAIHTGFKAFLFNTR